MKLAGKALWNVLVEISGEVAKSNSGGTMANLGLPLTAAELEAQANLNASVDAVTQKASFEKPEGMSEGEWKAIKIGTGLNVAGVQLATGRIFASTRSKITNTGKIANIADETRVLIGATKDRTTNEVLKVGVFFIKARDRSMAQFYKFTNSALGQRARIAKETVDDVVLKTAIKTQTRVQSIKHGDKIGKVAKGAAETLTQQPDLPKDFWSAAGNIFVQLVRNITGM